MTTPALSHRRSISTDLCFSDDHGVTLSVEISEDGVALTLEHFGAIESVLADARTPLFGLLPMAPNAQGKPCRREAFVSPAQLCAFADALSVLADQVSAFGDRPKSVRPTLVQ